MRLKIILTSKQNFTQNNTALTNGNKKQPENRSKGFQAAFVWHEIGKGKAA